MKSFWKLDLLQEIGSNISKTYYFENKYMAEEYVRKYLRYYWNYQSSVILNIPMLEGTNDTNPYRVYTNLKFENTNYFLDNLHIDILVDEVTSYLDDDKINQNHKANFIVGNIEQLFFTSLEDL